MTAHRASRALGLPGTAPSTTGAALARVQLPSAAGGGLARVAGG